MNPIRNSGKMRAHMLRLLVIYGIAILINYVWEMAQMPLYRGMPFDELRSYLLCLKASFGDGNITVAIYIVGLILFREPYWSDKPTFWKVLYLVAAGGIVAVLIEILALRDQRWVYSPSMPLLPVVGVGLSPLLQLIILPYLSFFLSSKVLPSGK